MRELMVTILGGSDQTGACNSMVLEYGNDAIIIDMGLGFPEPDLFGVDYLIPNVEYLKNKQRNIRGIVITHGHLDHIGALPYVLEDLGWPQIYAPRMAVELIKVRAEEFAQKDRMRLQTFEAQDKIDLGAFGVSFARVNHNIPDSFSVFVNTPVGKVIHTGDWKFDMNPYNEPPAEYYKFTSAGEEGVLMLCSDSTNAQKPGWSDSESLINPELEGVVEKAPGRVIAATFSSLITRLTQVIDLSQKFNRKVAISGRSMITAVGIARELGLIDVPDNLFIQPKDAREMPDKRVTILATGSQGEETSSLVRMANGTHRDFHLRETDTVILSSSVIPGNELAVYNLRDDLVRSGAQVFHNDLMDVHAGGHPHQEDLKLMIHMTKPKFLLPIQGSPAFTAAHKEAAVTIGFPKANVIMAETGNQISLDKNHARVLKNKVQAEPLLVDGSGIGDVGRVVLNDRSRLADDGVVFIAVPKGKSKGELHSAIQVETRGFVFVEESKDIINGIKQTAYDAVHKGGKPQKIKNRVENMVMQYVQERTRRTPLVIAVVG